MWRGGGGLLSQQNAPREKKRKTPSTDLEDPLCQLPLHALHPPPTSSRLPTHPVYSSSHTRPCTAVMARQLIDFEDDASARWPWWVGVVGGTVVGGAAAWLALQGAVSATDRQSVRDLVGLKPDSWLCGGASKFVRVGTFLCTGYAFRRSSDHVSRIVLITSDGTDYADDTAASSSTLCLQALWTGATAGLWAGLVSAGTSVAVVAAPSLFHKVYAAVRGKLSGRAAEVGDSHGVVVLSAAKKKARQRFLDAVSNAAATTAASTATVGAGITPAIASTVLTALAKLLRLGVPASVKNPPLTGPVPNWLSPKAQTALASLCAVAAYEPLTDRLQFIQNGIADVNTTSQPPFVARALGLSYVSTVKLTRRYTAPSAGCWALCRVLPSASSSTMRNFSLSQLKAEAQLSTWPWSPFEVRWQSLSLGRI